MAKTVIKLTNDDDYDFIVIGIVCQHRDYRLCHELNQLLHINLNKKEDYSVFNNKRMEDHAFSFYEYVNADGDRYNLISNRCSKGVLLPEQKVIDYVLLIRPDKTRIDESELLSNLKNAKVILGVYRLEVLKLKSKDNLLF
ncbi:MAG TPA: IPExxxVDY family protein [Bacteroidia bacterium]|jgi:hypothetical protein|nr:IPExxxVDY family protein [Bacteroidota bacterium]MBP9790324.1 IPExxxVDY family protein [Bacteroidia bacterium]MBP9923881.1 IPExxxVDY family protein [Bacteroidia bacterium]HQV99253.1 IPExxxVDY family protein [Bacteroidia bacterium]HQW22394.1 IPExxxVDY family protein [Bacteroidia bacterium]